MKNYNHPANIGDEDFEDLSLASVVQREYVDQIVAILVALQTDTPVQISYLKGFCSHTTLHEHDLGNGLAHYIVDQRTCVRISKFVKARGKRAIERRATDN
ncbi:MAG: hypothetical protein AB3N63_16650 [Puniceicoccaceae bacterium]